ncbi:MAG: Holliday junction branch migration protein RuvA [Bacilli bacterium]|nr:Holliday junction branch migration protein RuvA [Bacilli bacterium]
MYFYIKGKVFAVEKDFVILDVNNIGYRIYTSSQNAFSANEEVFLYLYEYLKEDNHYLIGFRKKEEQAFFNDLLKIKGIGPKIALSILKKCDLNDIVSAIKKNDVFYFKRHGYGLKNAEFLFYNVKKILQKDNEELIINDKLSDVRTALLKLGYDEKTFCNILNKYEHSDLNCEAIFKEVILSLS